MPDYIVFFLITGSTAAIAAAVSGIYSFRKKRRALRDTFGAPPPDSRSITQAENCWQAMAQLTQSVYIDDITWHNLDMDSLYRRLNTTYSEAGDCALYAALRQPCPGRDAAAKREKLISAFAKNEHLLFACVYALAALGRKNSGSVRILSYAPQELHTPYRALVFLLAALPFLSFLLLFVSPAAWIIALLCSLMVNMVATTLLKSKIITYHAIAPLSTAAGAAKKIAVLLRQADPALAKELQGVLQALRPLKMSASVMQFSTIITQMMYPDVTSIFLLPLLCYYHAVAFVQKSNSPAAALYRLLGEVDLACGVLSYRNSVEEYALPQFADAPQVGYTRLVHPLLDGAVDNSGTWSNDMLLTGSNASGKSTFIKALALGCIMAQSLNTCTCAALCLRPGHIVTAMAAADNIIAGDSYFVAEVKALERLTGASRGEIFCYFFIDEILKGTNTIERIAASQAILTYLHGGNSLCAAATHDIELVGILGDNFDNCHFSERVESGQVLFDYLLKSGPSNTRNAIVLLESRRFPASVTQSARAAAQMYDAARQWPKP